MIPSKKIKLFEVFQNFGGSKTHNFNSKNLVKPALNSIRSNFCKEGFIYFVGINESIICYMYSILRIFFFKIGTFNAHTF